MKISMNLYIISDFILKSFIYIVFTLFNIMFYYYCNLTHTFRKYIKTKIIINI